MGIPIIGMFFNRFPVDVEIWEKRAGASFIFEDKGRRRKDREGRYYYELKKSKESTKPVNPEFLYLSSKGKHKLKLFSPIPGVFQPMSFEMKKSKKRTIVQCEKCKSGKLEDNSQCPECKGTGKIEIVTEGVFNVIDEDTRRWMAMNAQETYQRFKAKESWLQKYGNILTMISFCTLFLVILLVVNGNMEFLSKSLQDVANAFTNAADLLKFGPPM